MRVHAFPKGIGLNVIPIARLEFELACYSIVVQHVSHYITETPTSKDDIH